MIMRVISFLIVTIAAMLCIAAFGQENAANDWMKKANELSDLKNKDKDFNEALVYYNKSIEANSSNIEAWNGKARALLYLGNYEEGLKCCEAALNISRTNSTAWSQRGYAFTGLGNYEEAHRSYDTAISLNSSNADTYSSKAITYFFERKYSEALDTIEIALKYDPENGETWYNKGQILEKLGRQSDADVAYEEAKKRGFLGPECPT